MEPSTKRRKIAPRPAEKRSSVEQQASHSYKRSSPISDALPHPERSDFESFARHLQDAAMLIYSQANRSPYTSVSVLLIRWEDDEDVEKDLFKLKKLFQEHYNFRTETWYIPTCSDPFINLTAELSRHLGHGSSDHLWIIYYNGYGIVRTDQSLYWTCNPHEDSPKIKWECIRSQLEEAHTDILLLLDTCAISETPFPGENYTKQIIAAYPPDQALREPGPRSFTFNLIEALTRLGNGRPFTIQRLHEEIVASKQNKFLQDAGLPNGSNERSSNHERMPIYILLSRSYTKSIMISPICQEQIISSLDLPVTLLDHEIQDNRAQLEQSQQMKFNSINDLTFEEPRALVCTTFLGEPSPDMSSFKDWLQHSPEAAIKIAVEGMFHGPPTVLLISMPISVWNVLAADRTCAFLGYVNSHNMTVEYQRLVNCFSPLSKATTFKELQEGKILLEARKAAASTPVMVRHTSTQADVISDSFRQDTSRTDPMILGTANSGSKIYRELGSSDHNHKVEESVEMHEAAEQLKALSYDRHTGNNTNANGKDHHMSFKNSNLKIQRRRSVTSQEVDDNITNNGFGESFNLDTNSPVSRSKSRRSVQKVRPKLETRCNLCSRAPFKDSSSLRKHIAAAHTRPFPCAFSFAGCTSTFGSKNEWKRHIASQHLCLTYYRCSSCPQSSVEGKGNEFNRKDLFTQHLRRMHAPFAIKKSLNKDDTKLQAEWEAHVKDMQNSCLVVRRQPPHRSACPKPDCLSVFEGAGSWDDWTEHVGRHMEKGEADAMGVDRLLAKWALDEGIIEKKSDGEFRLVGLDRDNGTMQSTDYYTDCTRGLRVRRSLLDEEDGSRLMKFEENSNSMM